MQITEVFMKAQVAGPRVHFIGCCLEHSDLPQPSIDKERNHKLPTAV